MDFSAYGVDVAVSAEGAKNWITSLHCSNQGNRSFYFHNCHHFFFLLSGSLLTAFVFLTLEGQ